MQRDDSPICPLKVGTWRSGVVLHDKLVYNDNSAWSRRWREIPQDCNDFLVWPIVKDEPEEEDVDVGLGLWLEEVMTLEGDAVRNVHVELQTKPLLRSAIQVLHLDPQVRKLSGERHGHETRRAPYLGGISAGELATTGEKLTSTTRALPSEAH